MATQESLIGMLKLRAQVETSEGFSDSDDLLPLINEALTEHNPALTIAMLPAREERLVLLLAWRGLCLVRASKYSKDPTIIGANGYGADKDSPFNKCLRLAEALRKEYDGLCNSLQVASSSFAPMVSDITVRDPETGYQVGSDAAPEVPGILLEMAAGESLTEGTSYIVQWAMDFFADFYDYTLYNSYGVAATPILENWNFDGTLEARINNTANKIGTFTDQTIKCVKINDVTKTATQNRFLVVCHSRTGKAGYSNELLLEAPAA